VRVLTAGGEVERARRYFWARGRGGVFPLDEALGIAAGRVSPGAAEVCCRMGMVQDFEQGARDAGRIGGVPVSKERLRQVVEAEAEAARRARDAGDVPAAWAAEQAGTAPGVPGSPTRVYVGVDGVMAPAVTQAEKDKRRAAHVARRQQRGKAGLGNARPLPPPRPGADEKFKEMKVGVFYDQDKARRHAFATAADCKAFGPVLAAHADQVGLGRAGEAVSLTDGAKWIAAQVCRCLTCLTAMLLDFYHLAQHVHGAAKACLGDTPAAREWARARLEEVKTLGVAGVASVLAATDALSKRVRSADKRDCLRRLREYVAERTEMLDYRTALARGWDIGSGPTEATCKTLTLRLRRPGMRWDPGNAAAMMNLIALYESGQAPAYWRFRQTHPVSHKAAA